MSNLERKPSSAEARETLTAELFATRKPMRETRPYRLLDGGKLQMISVRTKHTAPYTLLDHEPEDARLTGMTRSLYRRVMALNLRRPVATVSTKPDYPEALIA